MPELIEIAFWVERCDSSCPEFIYFADVKERLAFYLCKSGGIHIIEFDCDVITDEIVEGLGMYFVKGHCEEKFSDYLKIILNPSNLRGLPYLLNIKICIFAYQSLMKDINMNYRVSLSEMDKMAAQANSKKSTISLEEMKKQVQNLKNKSISKVKKNNV